MTPPETSTCRDCAAPIIWAANRTTGRMAPINSAPVDGGNIILHLDHTYSVVGTQLSLEEEADQERYVRYVSHFTSCPAAAERREVRNRKRRT